MESPLAVLKVRESPSFLAVPHNLAWQVTGLIWWRDACSDREWSYKVTNPAEPDILIGVDRRTNTSLIRLVGKTTRVHTNTTPDPDWGLEGHRPACLFPDRCSIHGWLAVARNKLSPQCIKGLWQTYKPLRFRHEVHFFTHKFMPETFDSRNYTWASFFHAFCLWLRLHWNWILF